MEVTLRLESKARRFALGDLARSLLRNRYVLYGLSVVGFLLIWHWAALHSGIAKFLPTPLEVWREMVRIAGERLAGKTLWGHLWASLRRVLIGFVIGLAVGVPVGLLMALSKHINAIVKPVFDLIKPMPPISWISLSILWFGIGEESKVFIIAIGAFVPALINSYNGIRLVDPALYDAVRMLGGNRRQELWQVTFPAGFPALFAGFQVALSVAWGCVLAAELVGARSGMGYIIVLGMKMFNPAMIIGGMVVIALVAGALALSLNRLEKVICPWKRELPQ
ncbi:MAG: ABC transporter permease [Deltaproteobacteria bacterium]|nr:ABC transporter permease [Deltaproteobacteria bacterium]